MIQAGRRRKRKKRKRRKKFLRMRKENHSPSQTSSSSRGKKQCRLIYCFRYGKGPYADALKKTETEVKELNQRITNLIGIKESDTGLSMPS